MTIDDVITAMYESMCFEKGERPDWERQAELFAPHARLVRVNDEGVFEFDPGSFRDDLEAKISSGSITSFWEGELQRETKEFGEIAHVLSLYETRPSRGAEPSSRALKSIQMFKRSGRWWISAMIWRREGGGFRIDDGVRWFAKPSS
jgi:hypothetical protein